MTLKILNLILPGLLLVGWGQSVGSATIRGYVEDVTNAEPLPAASVRVIGTDRGASTNLDGYFAIDYIQPGGYRLLVTMLGYRERQVDAVAYEGVSPPLHIQIAPSAIQLEEVEVTVERDNSELDRTAPVVSKVGLEAELVKVMPSLGGEMDVLRALQTIPGVKAGSDMSAALYVRGGSPDQTLILMDHNVVYNPNHLFGIFSTFNADAVKHIDLMKGAFPAAYGGRSGSVLEIITDEGNRKKTEGLASVGLVSARGAFQGPLSSKLLPGETGSYAFSARRTYFDPVLDFMRSTYDIDVPDYYFYDANGKVNLDLTPKTTLTMAGYWGTDKLDIDFGAADTRSRMGLSWGNRTLTTRVRHALGRAMFWSVEGSVSRYFSKIGMENENILIVKALDKLDDYSFKSDLEMYGSKNHQIKMGFWISQYKCLFHEEDENIVWVHVDAGTNNYATYLQDRWRISDRFEALPGLRFYYHEAGHHTNLDPRLALVYHVDSKTRVKLGGGRYSQYMNVMTAGDLLSNFDVWFPIDGTMKPSISDQIVTGLEYDAPLDLEFTTEAYYTDMHNVVTMNPVVDEGQVGSDAFLQGKGKAYGWEVLLRRMSGRWSGWVGYSLSWTKRQFPSPLINNGDWYYPKWDRRHDIIIVGMYQLSRSWEVSGSWRYNTGQGFTQALGVFTQRLEGLDLSDDYSEGRRILNGSMNNYRLPADHRLDLTFTHKHLLFKKNAQLMLSIYNVYSRRPYFMRYFDTSDNPVQIGDVKMLPIIPLVSYEVRF